MGELRTGSTKRPSRGLRRASLAAALVLACGFAVWFDTGFDLQWRGILLGFGACYTTGFAAISAYYRYWFGLIRTLYLVACGAFVFLSLDAYWYAPTPQPAPITREESGRWEWENAAQRQPWRCTDTGWNSPPYLPPLDLAVVFQGPKDRPDEDCVLHYRAWRRWWQAEADRARPGTYTLDAVRGPDAADWLVLRSLDAKDVSSDDDKRDTLARWSGEGFAVPTWRDVTPVSEAAKATYESWRKGFLRLKEDHRIAAVRNVPEQAQQEDERYQAELDRFRPWVEGVAPPRWQVAKALQGPKELKTAEAGGYYQLWVEYNRRERRPAPTLRDFTEKLRPMDLSGLSLLSEEARAILQPLVGNDFSVRDDGTIVPKAGGDGQEVIAKWRAAMDAQDRATSAVSGRTSQE